jgi:hypothetical protein
MTSAIGRPKAGSSMIKDIITYMGNREGDGFGARRAGSVVFGDSIAHLDKGVGLLSSIED